MSVHSAEEDLRSHKMGVTAPGIFARNCSVRRLARPDAAAFLDANHRMGSCYARYCYGLFVNRSTGNAEASLAPGTLVAVATFSNGRRMRDGSRSFEWIRYSSLAGFRVVGGMSRLLDAFVREVSPDDVMTYVDASTSDGAAYLDLGFEFVGTVERGGWTNLKLRKKFSYE